MSMVTKTALTLPALTDETSMSQAARDKFHLGFLRIVESPAGDVGGMLVTNRLGRPLEFQCTTPVKANRTQEILYGQTLRPFLHSELIGKTLVERLQVKPDLILIDQPSLLDLRSQIDVPVACMVNVDSSDLPDQTRIALGQQSVHVHRDYQSDADVISRHASHITADADLNEPLERVKDALLETTRPGAVA
jgi:hypothetical protein